MLGHHVFGKYVCVDPNRQERQKNNSPTYMVISLQPHNNYINLCKSVLESVMKPDDSTTTLRIDNSRQQPFS